MPRPPARFTETDLALMRRCATYVKSLMGRTITDRKPLTVAELTSAMTNMDAIITILDDAESDRQAEG